MNDFGAIVAAASLAHDREPAFWTFRWKAIGIFHWKRKNTKTIV
jgi:hypothetical protein